MKIDVCIVTKNPFPSIPGLEYVPVNKLIIETSTPLGLARMRAIHKVTTPIFAFIDDDAELDKAWFDTLSPYIQDPHVGAVQGILSPSGLGEKWNKALKKDKRDPIILKFGGRGFTHNTLIKTELVKDWIPPEGLSAWEDYDLSMHILEKDHSWLKVSTESHHNRNWKRTWNQDWGIIGRKRYFPSRRDSLVQIAKKLVWIIRVSFSFSIHWRAKIYRIYHSTGSIWAHMKWLYTSAGM